MWVEVHTPHTYLTLAIPQVCLKIDMYQTDRMLRQCSAHIRILYLVFHHSFIYSVASLLFYQVDRSGQGRQPQLCYAADLGSGADWSQHPHPHNKVGEQRRWEWKWKWKIPTLELQSETLAGNLLYRGRRSCGLNYSYSRDIVSHAGLRAIYTVKSNTNRECYHFRPLN